PTRQESGKAHGEPDNDAAARSVSRDRDATYSGRGSGRHRRPLRGRPSRRPSSCKACGTGGGGRRARGRSVGGTVADIRRYSPHGVWGRSDLVASLVMHRRAERSTLPQRQATASYRRSTPRGNDRRHPSRPRPLPDRRVRRMQHSDIWPELLDTAYDGDLEPGDYLTELLVELRNPNTGQPPLTDDQLRAAMDAVGRQGGRCE